MSSSASWPAADLAHEISGAALRTLVHSLRCMAGTVLVYLVCIHLSLLRRFLKIRLGKKIEPSATDAVVITGATSGFGLAVAKRLYARGFSVFACYYNDREAGFAELSELRDSKRSQLSKVQEAESANLKANQLFLVEMDVRSGESLASSSAEIKRLLDLHGLRLHCLLNNAAICADGPFELLTDEDVRDMVDTNIAGLFRLTKALTLRLIKDKGRVLNVSSAVRLVPSGSLALYGSSKAAVSHFSDALNQDLRPYGAASCTIYPGNFSLQTNIALSRVASHQKAVAQMGAEERAIYADRIEEMRELTNFILKTRVAHSREDPQRLAEAYGISLAELDETARDINELRAAKRLNFLQRLLVRAVLLVDGGARARLDLEHNGAVDCFESTITLARPPRETYAGTRLYQLYTGPMLDYLPGFVVSRLARWLVSSAMSR